MNWTILIVFASLIFLTFCMAMYFKSQGFMDDEAELLRQDRLNKEIKKIKFK